MGGEPAPGDSRDDAAGAAEPAPNAPDSSPGVAATVRELLGALGSRPVLVVTLVQTLGYCVWQAFTGFYPTYLIEVKGVAPTTATVVFGGFFALGIVVKPVAGTLYDGYGIRRTLPVVLAVVAVGMASVTVAERLLTILVATALASAVLGYATITLTFLTDTLPSSVQGTGLGVLRTGYMLVGAAAPTAMGALAEADLFDEGFLLLALVAGVAVVLTRLLPAEADAVAVGEADEPPSG